MANPAIRWAAVLVHELVTSGVTGAVLAPGSRCTPLTLLCEAHPELRTWSILDERSAAFAALGRGRLGAPTAVVTTSGTAVANCHPAVVEADTARVPLLVLSADRPAELRDSGANQTVDQVGIFDDAPRFERDLPAPRDGDLDDSRTVRSLRVTAARAVGAACDPPAGPVHLNCQFRKPLHPDAAALHGGTTGAGDAGGNREDALANPVAVAQACPGRDVAPSVDRVGGTMELGQAQREQLADRLREAERPLVVAGPADPTADLTPLATLADAIGAPLLADPLSGLRWAAPGALGGYDGFLPAVNATWPVPDLVVQAGAAPTSKRLRTYLADDRVSRVLVDPAGAWREASFTATDLVTADPGRLANALAADLGTGSSADTGSKTDALSPEDGTVDTWSGRFAAAESTYWELVDGARPPEAKVAATAIDAAPEDHAIVVGNSRPVRDVDRFAEPRAASSRTMLGNRGASGIDGTLSTGVGAATATDGDLTCVLGDLATLHDATGLAAVRRADVAPTIVVIDNDGGGIFHALPISDVDPPFTDRFRTPHGTDFDALAGAFDVEPRATDADDFATVYRDATATDGPSLIVVETDAAENQRRRAELDERVADVIG